MRRFEDLALALPINLFIIKPCIHFFLQDIEITEFCNGKNLSLC